jgi:intracellular sulfur oxidation DsrE/DsrF family protein
MNNTVCFITTDSLGQGDYELGKRLLGNFLRLLSEGDDPPVAIFCMNAGVRLVCNDSPVLAFLQKLQAQGCEVLACQTCIDMFDLQKQVQVGLVAGMADFLDLTIRHKVLTIS